MIAPFLRGYARAIAKIAEYAMLGATASLALMTFLVMLSALMRYVVGAPLALTEELVGLLFASMAFLVWPLTTLRGEHISVTFVSDKLPTAVRRWLSGVSILSVIVFCIVFGRDSYDFAMLTLKLGATSDVADIPLFPWMAIMPLVCLLVVLVLVARSVGAADGRKSGAGYSL